LRALPFLRATFCLDNLMRMRRNEGIDQSSSSFDLELRRTIIQDFSSRDWCVLFCVLLNQVEDLLFTILVDGDRLSSSCVLPRFAHPMRDGRLDTRSWTDECSRQCINGDGDIVTRFCNILHECNLVVSKLKSSRIRVPL
jgi:hypothetical protein